MRIRLLALIVVTAALLSGYSLRPDSSASGTPPRFDHLTLPVSNVARSVDFYQNIIGLHRVPDPFNEAGTAFMALNERDQLHLGEGQPQPSKTIAIHFAISVASLPAFQQRLTRAQIPYQDSKGVPSQVTLRPDGVHQIYFQDPDGYWIEVNDRR